MESDELKEWLKGRIAALDGPLVTSADLLRAKAYAEVLSMLEEPGYGAASNPLTTDRASANGASLTT